MRTGRLSLAASVIVMIGTAAAAQNLSTPEHDDMPRVPPAGVTDHVAPKATGTVPDKGALMGREVFSKDQLRVGQVELVVAKADGAVQAIQIKAGGFLGFGARLVEIPQDKFWMRGTNIQVDLTSDEISHLPTAKDQM